LYNFETPLANEVDAGIYLGDWQDAQTFPGHTLCVIETASEDRYEGMTYYCPILALDPDHEIPYPLIPVRARIDQLERALAIISNYHQKDNFPPLLVHCYAGMERSPLTLAYWLVQTGNKEDYAEAYEFLKSIRPIVEDRTAWLPPQ
jgi:protein-tyrosine phosphatase